MWLRNIKRADEEPLLTEEQAMKQIRNTFTELSDEAFKESSYFATYAKRARSALNIAAGVYVGGVNCGV